MPYQVGIYLTVFPDEQAIVNQLSELSGKAELIEHLYVPLARQLAGKWTNGSLNLREHIWRIIDECKQKGVGFFHSSVIETYVYKCSYQLRVTSYEEAGKPKLQHPDYPANQP